MVREAFAGGFVFLRSSSRHRFRRMQHLYEFGDFSLDRGHRVLLRAGEPVVLAPKVFDTLLALVESKGRVITRDELLDRVWAGAVVEEGGLSRNISILRKAL